MKFVNNVFNIYRHVLGCPISPYKTIAFDLPTENAGEYRIFDAKDLPNRLRERQAATSAADEGRSPNPYF
jgi:hypothetical protein